MTPGYVATKTSGQTLRVRWSFCPEERVNCCQLSYKEEVLGLDMNWPWTGEEDIFLLWVPRWESEGGPRL